MNPDSGTIDGISNWLSALNNSGAGVNVWHRVLKNRLQWPP